MTEHSAACTHARAHETRDGDAVPADAPAPKRPLARQVVLAPVLAYRRWISPGLAPRCRFEPSCSAYAVHAVDRFGILRGLVLAIWRVGRCHPLGGSGLDRVEDQRIFPLTARLKRASRS